MSNPSGLSAKSVSEAILLLPGWIRILRPTNLSMVFTGCIVGGFLVHGAYLVSGDLLIRTSIAGLAAAMLAASGNIVNDLFDISVDQINRADRALPSGTLSVRAARILGGSLTLIAFGTAWLVSPTHFIVAFVLWCLLFLYNWQLKTVPFLGNVIVGFLVAGSISYGALIDSTAAGGGAELKNLLNTNVLVAFGFAFFLTVTRELVKDIADIGGDRAYDIRTLPVRIGLPGSLSLIRVLVSGVLALSPLPYLIWGFSGLYLVTLLPVMALLVRVLMLLSGSSSDLILAGSHLKWAMAFGLFSLGASSIWPV